MSFKDIIGQDKAVSILLRTIQRGRVPSSYIFAGESGIGKKLAAMNLAKALNCLGGGHAEESRGLLDNPEAFSRNSHSGFDACDECPSCRKIDKGLHPDFLLISPDNGLIRIDEIRAIYDALSLKAFEGRYKIVIVDDADTMNQYAANAFLKTLEEPPEDSLLVLISSNPDHLPDTIKSRCSRLNFTPLSDEACAKVIEKVFLRQASVNAHVKKKKDDSSKTSGPPDPLTVSLLVRLSMGRPGYAVSGGLLEERDLFFGLLKEMLNAEKDGWSSREEMERWFDFILLLLRDMTILKITCSESGLINRDMKDYINKLSSSMDLKVIIESYIKLNDLKGCCYFNLNKSLTWNYTGSLLRARMDITNA
jgi:DNA polymerase III subunit delta'